jgi:hypothetical protein
VTRDQEWSDFIRDMLTYQDVAYARWQVRALLPEFPGQYEAPPA